jgi:GxxExxY protein
LQPVTERIIGCAFRVAIALGHGFVEKVHENALAHEIRKCGLGVLQQRGIVVFYDDVIVGEYAADLIVEDKVIVELKVVSALRRRACPAMPKLPAGDRQAPLPADQLRPAENRNPPHHRQGLIARTIPSIPAYPASSALKNT